MTKKWEKLLKKIDNCDNALSSAIQKLEQQVVYKGFDYDDEPRVDMSTANELIMSWHGSELFPIEFVELMESKKCIEPSDFRFLIDKDYD